MKPTFFFYLILAAATAYAGVVTGTLQSPSGLPIRNGTLSFNLQQAGLAVGSGSVVPLTASCYTSTDGAVVGLSNPTAQVVATASYGSGALPAGIYFVQLTFYGGSGETLPSPEFRIQSTGIGTLSVSPPATFPPNATGMRVYIGTTSGGETLQGATTSNSQIYTQVVAIVGGTSPPSANSSVCSIAFNDTIIPYSGYNVSLTSSTGNSYPGFPQAWQLNGGLNGTVNISNGAPLWNGTIVYPQPILAQPLNHGPQSISGLLNMSGYNLAGVGALGVGTNLPAWPIDVENGLINSSAGYLYNGGAGTTGQCLVSNGTAFVAGTCFTPRSTFYQTLQSNGTAEPQEPAINFSPRFALTDTPGTSTGVDLAASGVTADTYTNANVTVDSYGRVTTATSSPAIPTVQQIQITTGLCSTAAESNYVCANSVTWPTAFANTNYSVVCSANDPTSTPPPTGGSTPVAVLYVGSKTATGFQVSIQNGQNNTALATTVGEIDCVGVHP